MVYDFLVNKVNVILNILLFSIFNYVGWFIG